MKRYHVGDRTVVIIDGELYEKLLPLTDVVPSQTDPEPPKAPRGRPRKRESLRPGRGTIMSAVLDHEERKRRVHLTPELEAKIAADILAGLGVTDICKQHSISVGTYYRIKNESRSKPVIEGTI
jgi:hypothetical protein